MRGLPIFEPIFNLSTVIIGWILLLLVMRFIAELIVLKQEKEHKNSLQDAPTSNKHKQKYVI